MPCLTLPERMKAGYKATLDRVRQASPQEAAAYDALTSDAAYAERGAKPRELSGRPRDHPTDGTRRRARPVVRSHQRQTRHGGSTEQLLACVWRGLLRLHTACWLGLGGPCAREVALYRPAPAHHHPWTRGPWARCLKWGGRRCSRPTTSSSFTAEHGERCQACGVWLTASQVLHLTSRACRR